MDIRVFHQHTFFLENLLNPPKNTIRVPLKDYKRICECSEQHCRFSFILAEGKPTIYNLVSSDFDEFLRLFWAHHLICTDSKLSVSWICYGWVPWLLEVLCGSGWVGGKPSWWLSLSACHMWLERGGNGQHSTDETDENVFRPRSALSSTTSPHSPCHYSFENVNWRRLNAAC